MDDLNLFCAQISSRSRENQKAFEVLFENGCFGVAAGLLRQELDTLIRISYLCYECVEVEEGRRLINDSVNGRQWVKLRVNRNDVPIRDRKMVNIAQQLGGWESMVYDFGCKFIHLSNAHYYEFADPTEDISAEDKVSIIEYLKSKHEYPHDKLSFDLVKPYLPKVMKKITENIESMSEDMIEKYAT